MVPAGPDARLPNRASGSHKQEFHVTDLRCVDEKARPPHLAPIDRWAYHDAGPDSGAVNHGNGAPAGPCNALLRRTVARPGAGQPGPAAGGSGVGRSWWRRGRRVAATAGVAPLLTGGQMRAPAGRKRQDGDCGGGRAWRRRGSRTAGAAAAVTTRWQHRGRPATAAARAAVAGLSTATTIGATAVGAGETVGGTEGAPKAASRRHCPTQLWAAGAPDTC